VPSLQQILGKEEKFFDLFEASTQQSRASVAALRELFANLEKVSRHEFHGPMESLVKARHQDKSIHGQITQALCTSVVTSLEREDIMALAHSLYKIPKAVEKIGQRMLMAPHFLQGFDLGTQIAMLEKSTAILATMVAQLRTQTGLEKIRSLNDTLQTIEGEADDLVIDLYKVLYSSEMEGRRVVFLKDLFEMFEKITDRCRDAGNVLVQIFLKNS
jgi:hypothetical protein